jgi:hypothetical protein
MAFNILKFAFVFLFIFIQLENNPLKATYFSSFDSVTYLFPQGWSFFAPTPTKPTKLYVSYKNSDGQILYQ